MVRSHVESVGGRRRSLTWATLAALAALVSACSGGSTRGASVVSVGQNRTTVRAAVAPTTPAAPATAKTTVAPSAAPSSAAAATAAPIDAGALLSQTVENLRPGYQFETTIANGAAVVTTLTGRVVGAASQLAITRDGATVEYLQIPPSVWFREAGGDWSELASNAAPQEPLNGIAQPAALAVVDQSGDAKKLHATYAPESLGVTGGGAIEVDLTLAPDGSLIAVYPVDVSGRPLQVTEKLGPAADKSEIAPPG